jgi:hypothetical protein
MQYQLSKELEKARPSFGQHHYASRCCKRICSGLFCDKAQKDSKKWSHVFVGLSLHVEYAFGPHKNSPQIKCLCNVELVSKSTVEVVS